MYTYGLFSGDLKLDSISEFDTLSSNKLSYYNYYPTKENVIL